MDGQLVKGCQIWKGYLVWVHCESSLQISPQLVWSQMYNPTSPQKKFSWFSCFILITSEMLFIGVDKRYKYINLVVFIYKWAKNPYNSISREYTRLRHVLLLMLLRHVVLEQGSQQSLFGSALDFSFSKVLCLNSPQSGQDVIKSSCLIFLGLPIFASLIL